MKRAAADAGQEAPADVDHVPVNLHHGHVLEGMLERLLQRAPVAAADDQDALRRGVSDQREVREHFMIGVLVPLSGLDRIIEDQHPAEQPAGRHLNMLERGPAIVQDGVDLHGLGKPGPHEIGDPLHKNLPTTGPWNRGTKEPCKIGLWSLGFLVPWCRFSSRQGQKTAAAIAQPMRCTTCSVTATRISPRWRSRTASASSTILRTIASAFSAVPVCSYSMITP